MSADEIDGNGAVGGISNEQRNMQARLARPQHSTDKTLIALNEQSTIAVTDAAGRITYVNDRFCKLSKFPRKELVGRTHRVVNSGYHPPDFFADLWNTITGGHVWQGEIRNRARDGSEYWVDTTIVPLVGDDDVPRGYVALRTEESRRQETEAAVRRLAFVDPVTGLENYSGMRRAIERITLSRAPSDEFSAFATVSLDELSSVNEAFGFEAGDRLLLDAGRRLRGIADRRTRVGRLGSHTFGVLLRDLGDEFSTAEHTVNTSIRQVCDALSDASDPVSGIVTGAGVSIGHVLWTSPNAPSGAPSGGGERGGGEPGAGAPGDAGQGNVGQAKGAGAFIVSNDATEVVKCSEIARKRAKRLSGYRRVQRFEQRMLDEVHDRLVLVSDLRAGLGRGELRLYAQPIVDRERRLIGKEALIRWQHGSRGLIPPDEFIPLAEQTGLIGQIGDWALERACQVLAHWADCEATADLTLAVNLSERQLQANGFADRVRKLLAQHPAVRGRLKFELTESLLHSDLARTISLLERLRADGVHASLDDFGTGFSSLNYLRRLPIQQLKIDRSFVSSIVEDDRTAAIAETMVRLARVFGLQIVGEGVETEEQFDCLRALGVDAFQGYLFGGPEPIEVPPTAR